MSFIPPVGPGFIFPKATSQTTQVTAGPPPPSTLTPVPFYVTDLATQQIVNVWNTDTRLLNGLT